MPLHLLLAAMLFAPASPAVDLTLKDAAGHKVHLRDLRGKPVLLNFWATWCGPCKAELPMLVELEKEYAARGVVFIAASLDDSKTKGNISTTLPVWFGATADDLDHLKLGGAVPATAFLDPEGHIIARILGQARPEEVKERLDWLTGNQSTPTPLPLVKHLP